MSIATGVAKQLRMKVESAWGVAPGASGAQLLRRVASNLSLRKETFQSAEKVTHYQRVDFRHGVRSVGGAITGEISPGTYEDFIAACVRKVFVAVSAITGASITITGAGPTYTISRAAGSWLTDGVKAGQVGRLTAGSFNAANLNKNLFVLAAVAADLTVMPLNGVALFAEGPIAASTWTIPGKETYVPTSGHTDSSFAIEHWHADVSLSELFLGCKPSSMAIGMPPSGMSTIGFDFMGKDVTTAGAAYYTTPTAETESGVLAAVNGLLVAQGGQVALLTGLNFGLAGGHAYAGPVVGSNTHPDIGEGRVVVEGSFTALFQDATLRDYFLNETEVSLLVALSTSPAAAAEFMSFSLPRIKIGSADKDDPDQAITQTHSFAALLNTTGGAGTSSHETTLAVQDSLA